MVYTRDSIDSFLLTRNQLSLLECMPYIEREYVDPTPTSIPLMELSDCPGVHFIRYTDLEKLAEVEEISLQEAAIAVQDANLLAKDQFVVAMEEWRPLLDPSLIEEFPNVLLIKEVNTPTYRFCETCMNAFMYTRDGRWVDLFLETPGPLMEYTEAQLDKYMQAVQKQHPDWDYDQVYNHAYRTLQAFDKKDAAMTSLKQKAENPPSNGTPQPAPTTPQPSTPKTAPLQQSQPTQQPEQQGWWARKWAAFRNWMDSLGSNGDQKSTWFTNMTNKVKSFFNGGAQTTQAANQQQQTQNKPTNQPTSSSGSRNMGVNAAVDVVGQRVMDTGAGYVDKLANKINNFAQDTLGIDASPFIQIGSDIAKNAMGEKIAQVSDIAKDKGGDMANAAMDKVGHVIKQGYQKLKTAVTGAA